MTITSPSRASVTDRTFRSLVEHSTDVTILVGPDGRCTYLSPAVEAVWGYQAPSLVGEYFIRFVNPDDRRLVRARVELANDMAGETVTIECRLSRADRSWRHVEARITNLVHDEAVHAVGVVLRDVHDRIEATRDLNWRAHHDVLTGLSNRAALLDRLGAVIGPSHGSTHPALLYIDLDGFKEVNDRLGHEAGDRILAAVGARLRNAVRSTDHAARIGGDEFVVVVEDQVDLDAIMGLARRISRALAQPIDLTVQGGQPAVSASIGIAFAVQGDGPKSLLAHADRALYEAKRRGPAHIHVFDPGH